MSKRILPPGCLQVMPNISNLNFGASVYYFCFCCFTWGFALICQPQDSPLHLWVAGIRHKISDAQSFLRAPGEPQGFHHWDKGHLIPGSKQSMQWQRAQGEALCPPPYSLLRLGCCLPLPGFNRAELYLHSSYRMGALSDDFVLDLMYQPTEG